jgi:hypothetical protein
VAVTLQERKASTAASCSESSNADGVRTAVRNRREFMFEAIAGVAAVITPAETSRAGRSRSWQYFA